MRLSLILFMLILLPLATGVHAWLFCRDNLPVLTQEAVRRLQNAGVSNPVVDVRFFDIAVTGEAPDPASREKAVAAIRSLVPLRLQPGADRIYVIASIRAKLEQGTLRLSGWLPEGDEKENIMQLLHGLRPDLRIASGDLCIAPEVHWPDGVKVPLTPGSSLLKPIIDTLRVPAELHIVAKDDATIVLSGLLPETALREEVIAALSEVAGSREVDPTALKASPHVLTADFAKREALAAFVGDFFSAPPPRSFHVRSDGIPHMDGAATREMESRWLTLLRPVTGAAKVDARLTLMPSIYHFPGYKIESKLQPEVLNPLREILRGFTLVFEVGATRLTSEAQTRLAALAPTLLAAGPALELVIGAHPDPVGPERVEKETGRARAEAVQSFLIDQGVPAQMSAVVFDPVPSGSPSAPAMPRCVEFIIK